MRLDLGTPWSPGVCKRPIHRSGGIIQTGLNDRGDVASADETPHELRRSRHSVLHPRDGARVSLRPPGEEADVSPQRHGQQPAARRAEPAGRHPAARLRRHRVRHAGEVDRGCRSGRWIPPGSGSAAFVAYDFCYYWKHRFGHEWRIMWASHIAHHQSEEFNLSTALRQTGTDYIGFVFYIPLYLAGIPAPAVVTVGSLNLIYQFWVHTEHIRSSGRSSGSSSRRRTIACITRAIPSTSTGTTAACSSCGTGCSAPSRTSAPTCRACTASRPA